jgi:hypothetical protein
MTAHACKHTRKKATILPPEHGNMLRTSAIFAIFSTDKEGQPANEQPYFPRNMATRFEQVLFSAPTKK